MRMNWRVAGKRRAVISRLEKSSRSFETAMTLFELLFFLILIGIGIGVGSYVSRLVGGEAGVVAGIAAGILAVVGFVFMIKIWGDAGQRRHCRKMAEKYTRIFHVRVLPTDEKCVIKTKNSEIKVGDYGWECGPIEKNGLIYLEGFDEKWKLIWWAGFQTEQIEFVGTKPISQYDRLLPERRELFKTPCPFPVQPRSNIGNCG